MMMNKAGTTLWQVLKRSAQSAGSAPALLCPQQGIALSYAELLDKARGLSLFLHHDHGVHRDHVVATDLPNVAEGLLLHLACSRLGAAVATAKDSQVLATIPGVQCAVTASGDSWMAAAPSLQSPPMLLDASSIADITPCTHDDDEDDLVAEQQDGSDRPLGYFGSAQASLTHGVALAQGAAMKEHFQMTPNDRVCVSITLYHAFGIGSACSSALLSGAAIVLPAVGGLRGCGVPSQRAHVTLQTIASETCTLLFCDTHTLKAFQEDTLASQLHATDLSALRGGVCKTGSGTEILDETVELAGVKLATLGKKK